MRACCLRTKNSKSISSDSVEQINSWVMNEKETCTLYHTHTHALTHGYCERESHSDGLEAQPTTKTEKNSLTHSLNANSKTNICLAMFFATKMTKV